MIVKEVIIIKKQILVPALMLALAGGVLVSVPYSLATDTTDHRTNLVQKIAQKFGLKEADVEQVFEEVRKENQTARQTEMQSRMEENLGEAVMNGKLTEEQKQKILTKHKELQEKRESDLAAWQDLTREQKREKMQAQRQELDDWAKANNIDTQYLFGITKGMMGKGMGMGRSMGRSKNW